MQREFDSLMVLAQSDVDTTKYSAWKELVALTADEDLDTAFYFAYLMEQEALRVKDPVLEGDAYNSLGYLENHRENFEYSIEILNKALVLRRTQGDQRKIAITLNQLGTSYHRAGELEMAMNHYYESMEVAESAGVMSFMGYPVGNLSKLYMDMGETEKSKEFTVRALEIAKELGDTKEMAGAYNGLGNLYQALNSVDTARLFYKEALRLYEECKNLPGQAHIQNNLAILEFMEGDHESSLSYFKKAMVVRKEQGDNVHYAQSLNNMGLFYMLTERYDSALYYNNLSLEVAKEIGALLEIKDAYEGMYQAYDSIKDYKQSFIYYQKFVETKDSILSVESLKNMQELETKYKMEEQRKALELKDIKLKQKEEKQKYLESEKNFQFIIFSTGGLALIIVLVLILVGYFNKKKANEVLEEKNDAIERKNKEIEEKKDQLEEFNGMLEERNKSITDSIKYAKHIQKAMLPDTDWMKQHLPDHFILFKPRDIVSGDFYWWHLENDQNYLAVADCTGHGVPGAMVSVVCSNALNKSVKEKKIEVPSEVLDNTTNEVIDAFSKSGGVIKDGMDIALMSIPVSVDHDGTVSYSGANNPLWIVRKGSEDYELIEYKADRQPVGKFGERKPFTNREVKVQKGDTIYIFSDGYADQFGGPRGKKFKYSRFKELLISIQPFSMEDQHRTLNQRFEEWKGDIEQIDDVCIIGLRI